MYTVVRYICGAIVLISALTSAGMWLVGAFHFLMSTYAGSLPGIEGLSLTLSLTCMSFASYPVPIPYSRSIRTGLVVLSILFFIPYENTVPVHMNIRLDILILLAFLGLAAISLGLCWLVDPFHLGDTDT